MGKAIVSCIEDTEGVDVCCGTEKVGHPAVGQDLGELTGVGKKNLAVVDRLESVVGGCDVLIDFSSPETSMETLAAAEKAQKSLVLGTTGFNSEQKGEIQRIARKTRCVMAPNMSIGVNVLFKMVEEMARVLGAAYDVEIVEAHHKFKKDAPSGTAVRLSEIVAETLGRRIADVGVYGRKGMAPRTPEEIGIHTLRAGDIVGEHRVIFGGMGETLEVSHRAQSRDTFARGAVRAAQWLMDQPVGLYDMQDVLGLRP